MIDFFLRTKHWVLFILLIGFPIVFQFYGMTTVFSNFDNENLDFEPFLNFFSYIPYLILLITSIHFGWLWSIVIGIQEKLEGELKVNLKLFKIFFFIPLLYIVLISFSIGGLFKNMVSIEGNEDIILDYLPKIVGVIFPLHFFSMFCIGHTMFYAAKMLKTAEDQKQVTFSDFIGEFFLIWFYPIGVWIIQPRINKLAEENTSNKLSL